MSQTNEYVKRWQTLKAERSSFDSHWMELQRAFLPRSGRFLSQDRNRGDKRNQHIIDNTVIKAVRTLGAGLQAGMNSPARPWMKLSTPDKDLAKYGPVKIWLDDCTKLVLRIFAKSNMYRALHKGYEELGVFGTWAGIQVQDFRTVTHVLPLTVGEYCLATDWKGQVHTLYRQFDLTVQQLVNEFGLESCSLDVQHMYRSGSLDKWVSVIHAIEPRQERDTTKADGRNMPFKSVYFELSAPAGKYLRESGYRRFRGLGPRWDVTGSNDVYGNSPGMDALGDAKQLQHEQKAKGKGISYMADPPMVAPSSAKNGIIDLLPGGISFIDSTAGNGQSLRSAFDVRLELAPLLDDIRDVRERVNSAFHADLFLLIANDTRSGVTATEVAQRHEEKLIMLGPTLERLTNEIHVPAVDTTFEDIIEAGLLPPPPPEMQGQELQVEFTSMLAQAQRAVASAGVDRWVANLGSVATMKPDVLDKFDADVWADEYADMMGVSPSIVVPGERVALIRQARADLAQQQAQQEQMAQAAEVARNLGAAQTTEGTVLGDVINRFSGYTTAGA